MKNKLIYLILFVSFFYSLSADAKVKEVKTKWVRGCDRWGFFTELFWTINHLQFCETEGKIPVILWDNKFAYFSKDGYNGSLNGWEYYFEPVSNLSHQPGDRIYKNLTYNNFTCVWWYMQYIKNMHLLTPEEQKTFVGLPLPGNLAGENFTYPTDFGHPYGQNFRKYVKSLMDKYVRIKDVIKNKIDAFYLSNMKGNHVVGIHLRGNFLFKEVGTVPLEAICNEANKVAKENTIFFVATDQKPLLEAAKKLLKGKVIAYEAYRQTTTTSPFKPGQNTPEMGEDVLIETVLLSCCDHLIHTISNVSTAALYFNPNLPHTTLYCVGDR